MKGHLHCTGERIEAHQFIGKDISQALGRLGKWLHQNGGMVHSIAFCDADGDPLYDKYCGAEPKFDGTVYVTLHWSV